MSQRVATAIQEATGAPTVYFMSFGENYPHFHFLVIARPADLPSEFTGAGIVAMRAEGRDLTAAELAGAAVREVLERRAAATS